MAKWIRYSNIGVLEHLIKDLAKSKLHLAGGNYAHPASVSKTSSSLTRPGELQRQVRSISKGVLAASPKAVLKCVPGVSPEGHMHPGFNFPFIHIQISVLGRSPENSGCASEEGSLRQRLWLLGSGHHPGLNQRAFVDVSER